MSVAVRRGAAGSGTVAVSISALVTAVRVAPLSFGVMLHVQQVGVGGSSRWPGGCRDLDLARAFHCLQRER